MGVGGSKVVTFDTRTGALTLKEGGSTDTLVPDDKMSLENYMAAIQKAQDNGFLKKDIKSTGFVKIGQMAETSRLKSVAKSEELPSVRAIQIDMPPTRAVVYVDDKGSKFMYRNDPKNLIKLVPGGFEAGVAEQAGVGVKSEGQAAISEQASPDLKHMYARMQCMDDVLIPILTASQKETLTTEMNKCIKSVDVGAKTAPPTVPAPVGVSTYAFEGAINKFTGGTGYPNWVILVAIFAVITALVVAKKM